jgi:hypothetical protein
MDLTDLELAPALTDNVFFHAALEEDLPRTAREGLRPGGETGRDNFPEFVGSDRDCVYLWPNVMAAWAYIQEDREGRFAGQPRQVLKVSGLDLTRLAPDNEELGRFLQEPECFPDGEELYAEICARGLWDDERNRKLIESWSNYDASATRDLIRLFPEDLLLRLADSFATGGEALMYRGSIPATAIEVASLNREEELRDLFDESYPSPYSGEPTAAEEDAYYEALDAFFAERTPVSDDEMQRRLQEIESWPENREEAFFSLTPLTEHPLARPRLSDMAVSEEQASALPAPALGL